MTEFQNTETTELLYKICVLGDIGTGKTSLIKQYVHGIFSENYKSTIGVDFALKRITSDDETIRIQFWDIAGQERYGNMTRVYYKESVGAFIMADALRPTTIDAIKKWKSDFDAKSRWQDLYSLETITDFSPIILLINKVDLLDDEMKSQLNYDDFCKEHGFHCWFAISTKTNEGIDEACNEMINICKKSILIPKPIPNPIQKIKCIEKTTNKSVNEPVNKQSLNENESELFLCKLMTEIFTLCHETDCDDEVSEDKHAKKTIKQLKMLFHKIYFDERMNDVRKLLHSNHESFGTVSVIHDMLINVSIKDSTKLMHISNYILDYGKSQCS